MTNELNMALTNLATAVREKAELDSNALLTLDDMADAINSIPIGMNIHAGVLNYTVASGSVKVGDFVRFVDDASVVTTNSCGYHLGLAKTSGSAGDVIEVYTMNAGASTYYITVSTSDAIEGAYNNPTTITSNGTATLIFNLTNNNLYISDNIRVSGADYTWTVNSDKTVGTLVLSNPYSDVSIYVNAGKYTLNAPTVSISGSNINITNVDSRAERIVISYRVDGSSSTYQTLQTLYCTGTASTYTAPLSAINIAGTYEVRVCVAANDYWTCYANNLTYTVASAPTTFSGKLYIYNSRNADVSSNYDLVYRRDYDGTDSGFKNAIDAYGGGEYIDLSINPNTFASSVPMDSYVLTTSLDEDDVVYLGVDCSNMAIVNTTNCSKTVLVSATESNTYQHATVYKIYNFQPGDAVVSVCYTS